MNKTKRKGKAMWMIIYITAFIITFIASAIFKLTYNPNGNKYKVAWNEEVGTVYQDLQYGKEEANKFDLYVPANSNQESYGLVVYLHAGGFTAGDKADDKEMLQWLCSKGYVAAGINYTLRTDENSASVYSQSIEIKESIPHIIEQAQQLGYQIDKMAIGGGSAGGCLALIYGYRDGASSPVPVNLVFEAVGPASFYQEDWGVLGLDQSDEAAATLFSVMAGVKITPEMMATNQYLEAVKPISADRWIDKNSAPAVLCYGKHDKVQPFLASKPLIKALKINNIDYQYFVAEHSGHGLQNDNQVYINYIETVEDYLAKYLPVNN